MISIDWLVELVGISRAAALMGVEKAWMHEGQNEQGPTTDRQDFSQGDAR